MSWVCPACRGSLIGDSAEVASSALHCARCPARYPLLDGLPVLTVDAPARLTAQLGAWAAERQALRQALQEVERAQADRALDFRAEVFAARAAGLRRNDRLAQEAMHALLAPVALSKGNGPPAEPVAPGSIAEALAYLYGDWVEPLGEVPGTHALLAAAEGLIAQAPPGPSARALFLGAGAGGQAVALGARFARAWAIDLSAAQGWLFARARRGPIDFAWLHERAPFGRSDLTRLATTRAIDERPGLAYAIADAARLPLPDAAASHVLSLFFTDLLPLPQLLPEVRRVLAPGGRFLHVGPLRYGFYDFAWRLAPEELALAFAHFGLALGPLRTVGLTGRGPAGGAELQTWQGLAFSAARVD